MIGDRTKKLAGWFVLGAVFTLAALVAAGAYLGVFRRDGPYRPRTTPASAPLLVPEAMTILPGIHMLGGLEPSAAYVVESSDGLILVDSGVDGDAGRLKSQMSELGLDWRRIKAVLITHVHGDHSGGAERIRAETGAKVYAGAGDADVLRAGGPRESMLSVFYRPSYVAHQTTIDVELKGDEAIEFGDVHIRALGTPGHTPGSICYLIERNGLRALFAGDVMIMLRGDENPVSQVRKPLGTYSAYLAPKYRGDAAAYLSTLLSLRRLPVPGLVLPGHPCAAATRESPHLSQERWEEILDGGINDMRILIDRYRKDGRDFLDGEPKEILPELYYFGEFKGASVYGFSSGSKFFLIDAPGGPGLLDWVRTRLKQIGARAADPVAVLLTSCGGPSIAGLKEVIQQTGASVVAARAGLDVIRKECGPKIVLIAADDLPAKGWFPVRVIPLRGRGVAPVAYVLKFQAKTALFSGQIPIASKVERELELMPEISTSRAIAIDYLYAVYHLSELKPDLWFPASSADGQNANLYDADWKHVIDLNYRIGFHAALGHGLLAQKAATSTAARGPMDDDSVRLAREFTGSTVESGSLRGLHELLGLRGRVGLAAMHAESERLSSRFELTGELPSQIGLLELHEGHFSDAIESLRYSSDSWPSGTIPPDQRAQLATLLGIAAIRQVTHDPRAAKDLLPEAVKDLQAALESQPAELRIRWLLDVARTKLGNEVTSVPPLHPDPNQSLPAPTQGALIRFENVATESGLKSDGPRITGSSLFDDFNGDAQPDVFIASLDTDRGAGFYINRGGKFADASQPARLHDQSGAIRACAADYDNDGDLDVLLVRGAGEAPLRLSLLRNDGKGAFEDVTARARLDEPISAASASWGDFDRDGFVDLYVCGEFLTDSSDPGIVLLDPRNRSRLYRNRRDGTFENVAAAAGVAGDHRAVDSAWGDFDGDGHLDLFVSSWDGPCRLYRNRGDGHFEEVAAAKGVAGPPGHHASACFFSDFDNDGRLDLLVGDGDVSINDLVEHRMGRKPRRDCHPRLYRNVGADKFQDVSREMGLDRPIPSLNVNFADLDNDGFLDLYFGAGLAAEMAPVPNSLLRNNDGKRFDDVTESSGTRRLQTRQTISFADANGDGLPDILVMPGGASPGTCEEILLFNNKSPSRHWLAIKLVGTKTNRGALGAKIRVELKDAHGAMRSIHRTIGSASSSAGNSLVETIGLGDAEKVDRLVVTWPVSRSSQEFRDVTAGQLIEITEGSESIRKLQRPTPSTPGTRSAL